MFLDDYDLASAAWLVRGCDVWLNLPRPPLEASGTSGMKSAINGGLQLSVLDGWWAEAYHGDNGWALPGDVDPDPAPRTSATRETLHELLDEEVVPAFYDRDEQRPADRWLALMRASLRSLAPRFSASRMLSEYVGRTVPRTVSSGLFPGRFRSLSGVFNVNVRKAPMPPSSNTSDLTPAQLAICPRSPTARSIPRAGRRSRRGSPARPS